MIHVFTSVYKHFHLNFENLQCYSVGHLKSIMRLLNDLYTTKWGFAPSVSLLLLCCEWHIYSLGLEGNGSPYCIVWFYWLAARNILLLSFPTLYKSGLIHNSLVSLLLLAGLGCDAVISISVITVYAHTEVCRLLAISLTLQVLNQKHWVPSKNETRFRCSVGTHYSALLSQWL